MDTNVKAILLRPDTEPRPPRTTSYGSALTCRGASRLLPPGPRRPPPPLHIVPKPRVLYQRLCVQRAIAHIFSNLKFPVIECYVVVDIVGSRPTGCHIYLFTHWLTHHLQVSTHRTEAKNI